MLAKETANGNSTPDVFAHICLLVMGNNQCWGKGATIFEAWKMASRPLLYNIYLVHIDTRVDPISGALFYPPGCAPRLIQAGVPTDPDEFRLRDDIQFSRLLCGLLDIDNTGLAVTGLSTAVGMTVDQIDEVCERAVNKWPAIKAAS